MKGEKMAKVKSNNQKNNSFRKISSNNYEEVEKWPEWKRSIVISSSTASTGKFIYSKSSQKK